MHRQTFKGTWIVQIALDLKNNQSVFSLWANNGDAISRQYAGTNALKGDFTRTGERNFSGMMKDGVNSASRYYLNQFRDDFRQATIDIVTGERTDESNVCTLCVG